MLTEAREFDKKDITSPSEHSFICLGRLFDLAAIFFDPIQLLTDQLSPEIGILLNVLFTLLNTLKERWLAYSLAVAAVNNSQPFVEKLLEGITNKSSDISKVIDHSL